MKNTTNKLEIWQTNLEKILSGRASEIARLESTISQYEEVKQKAIEDMTKATASDNLEDYRNAKSRRDIAEDSASMYRAQLEKLIESSAMSKEDYESIREEIVSDVNQHAEDTKLKIVDLISKIEALSDENEAYRDQAVMILRKYQSDAYKDPTIYKAKNSTLAMFAVEKINPGISEQFVYYMRSSFLYGPLTGHSFDNGFRPTFEKGGK